MLNTVNLLYSQMLRENEERERKQRHYPSSLCAVMNDGSFIGKCRRATWYEWKGHPRSNRVDAPGLFKMQVGDLIHEHLSATLNRALSDLGYTEESLTGDGLGEEVATLWNAPGLSFPVSGRMDKRLVAPDGKRIVVEWKSTYGRGADFIKRDGPKEDNLMQCAAYLEQDVFPVDAAVLMYAGRDSGYMFGYYVTKHGDGLMVEHMGSKKVTFSQIGWPAIVEGLSSLESSLESVSPLRRDYRESEWRCSYCGHKDLCWGSK